MAGFNLATPPLECKPLPGHKSLDRLHGYPSRRERKGRTDYDIHRGIAAAFSSFDGRVGVIDGLLDV